MLQNGPQFGANGVTLVGVDNEVGDNMIVGHSGAGVFVTGETNVINSNLIGTEGQLRLANGFGISVQGATVTIDCE